MDIKPDNFVFRKDGSMILCDLGSAMDAEIFSNRVTGTDQYFAPEILCCKNYPRNLYNPEHVDVFNLGTLIFTMEFL